VLQAFVPMKKCCFLILLLFSLHSPAQEKNADIALLNSYSDTLKAICKKLFATENDADKKKYNQQLVNTFERALQLENSFTYEFDSLNDIAQLRPNDKAFRMINWNVAYKDGTQEYFGFIQNKFVQVKKKGLFQKETTTTIKLFPLIDKSAEIKSPENTISDNKNWYGMLYYAVITKKTKKQTYYTLLGWDGNDKLSRKKIIDVLTFDATGAPRFGADIFEMPKRSPKRVIFEYAATCTMSLKYNSKKDSIVFDHLAPDNPTLAGQYQYYCPDMSYDGFGFKKGKWHYGADLNIMNDKSHNDKFYNDPHNTKPTRNGSNTIIPKEKKKKK
jgi:hypothetical protein